MKPTYGLISRYGNIPFASSFDAIGPLTNTAFDNAQLLNDLSSNDPCDQTNFKPEGYDATNLIGKDVKGLKVGILKEWEEVEINPTIRKGINDQLQHLRDLGIEIKRLEIEKFKQMIY